MTRSITAASSGRTSYVGYTAGSTGLQNFTCASDRYRVSSIRREPRRVGTRSDRAISGCSTNNGLAASNRVPRCPFGEGHGKHSVLVHRPEGRVASPVRLFCIRDRRPLARSSVGIGRCRGGD